MNSAPDQMYRRFLLGLAAQDEERLVEEAVLTGDKDALFLETSEDELIDDYLSGEMSEDEKRAFETQFLTTEERRQRLTFTSALMEYSQKLPKNDDALKTKSARRGYSWSMLPWKQATLVTASVSVLLAVLAGLELLQLRKQSQIAQEELSALARVKTASVSGNAGSAQAVKLPAGTASGAADALIRIPLIEIGPPTRDVSAKTFRVPVDARFAQIDWELTPYRAEMYREELLSESGQQLWAQEFSSGFLSAAKKSTMVVPASVLTSAAYNLRLEGRSASGKFEELSDSVFVVVRE